MGGPNPGHLFRLSLVVLFLGLLGVRVGVELIDANRHAERAREAMEAQPAPEEERPTLVLDGKSATEPKT